MTSENYSCVLAPVIFMTSETSIAVLAPVIFMACSFLFDMYYKKIEFKLQ
jgi:hypothetical protein